MRNQDLIRPLFEQLDANKIASVVSDKNLRYLADIEIFESIPSTNQYLLERAKASPTGRFCFAEEQTAGRGRRGRVWDSSLGSNIACSLLWRFKEQKEISGLSIAVAVMVTNALHKFGISAGLQLKWPNDILFANRKLVGILLEKIGDCVVIGIGINLNLPEPKIPERIDVAEITGKKVARNHLAGLLVNELLECLPMYQQFGLKEFMEDWRKQDYLNGRSVTVFIPEKTITGSVQGINEQGELLLLDHNQQLQVFRYGEVSVRLA